MYYVQYYITDGGVTECTIEEISIDGETATAKARLEIWVQAIDEDPDTNQFYIYNTISAIDLEAELVKEDGSWKVLSHIQYDASDSPAKASSDLKEFGCL